MIDGRPISANQMLLLPILSTIVYRSVAFANFLGLMPNGMHPQFSGQGHWNALGHTRPLPDHNFPHIPFRRNEFGRDFFRAGHSWTRELCMADSDGDGMTNGEELGDPECIWRVGEAPAYDNVTHPGVPDSSNSSSPDRTELDLPSAFNVTGGGFEPANGVYVLVKEYPAVHAWEKRLAKQYLWKSTGDECVLWLEKGFTWGISCYGDHVYFGGGNGSVPSQPAIVRSGSESWERGVPPVPELEPLEGEYGAPMPPPGLPTDVLFDSHWLPALGFPIMILSGFALRQLCVWLPAVRWKLVAGMYIWLWWGASVGIHRFFSHRIFKTGFVVKNLLALAGGMTMQDTPAGWAAMHRVHHRACEGHLDFHSPVFADRGFWFSHMSWLSTPREHVEKMGHARIEDLVEDEDMWLAWNMFPDKVAIGYVLVCLCIAMFVSSRHKAYRQSLCQLPTLTWFYLCMYATLPVFGVWHSTMLINSATHMWGPRPFVDGMVPHIDTCESRNVAWLFPIQLGENWHNNHHAAPGSASTWVYWYQVDVVFMMVRAMEALGLVWDVRVELPVATRPAYDLGSDHLVEPAMQLTAVCGFVAIITRSWIRSHCGGSQ
jgi:stearoyl-CoA desaturase (delta-9 desaturase)